MRIFSTKDNNSYSSLLECLDKEDFTIEDLNFSAILEFLTFGNFYFEETILSEVHKKFSHQKYTLDKNQGFENVIFNPENPLREQQLSNPVEQFLSFFEERADHLKQRKISIDLTGGIDSRLIATVLQYFNIPFDAAFSLDSGDEQEAEIVRKVADKLGANLHIVKSDEINSDEEAAQLYKLSDGLLDVLSLKSLKNTQQWRKDNGYDLVITGVGGELYKDFWWQQDFPFYSRRRSNIERLVNTRMYPTYINPNWFGKNMKEAVATQRTDFLKKLQKYKKALNTQTYDQIYYHVRIKEQVSALTEATENYLDSYSPLLESELLQIGYNLPRSQRFFNRFHREIITRLGPEIAKIPTTEGGMSISNKCYNLSRDLGRYGIDKSRKVRSRILSKKKQIVRKRSSQLIENKVKEAMAILKEVEIFSNNVQSQNLPEILWGRILTLGMIIKKMR